MYRLIAKLIMMTISYPTLVLIEDYLTAYFKSPISLYPSITAIGSDIGKGNMALLPKANVSGEPITGIDIPILIKDSIITDEAQGTIMILEQDPLRNLKEFLPRYGSSVLKTHAIVGTPNALHSTPVKFYLKLVEELTKKGWEVYLTDTYKIWAPGLKKKGKKWRWTINEKKLLLDEIDAINPTKVLLLGNEAQRAYNDVLCLSKKPLSIIIIDAPHPSGMANKAWKKKLGPTILTTDDEKLKYILNLF